MKRGVIAIVMFFTTVCFFGIQDAVAIQLKDCSPEIKEIPRFNHQVLLGDGYNVSSDLTNVTFTLLQTPDRNCRYALRYALDYNEFNHWQTGHGGRETPGYSVVHIDLMTADNRVILKDAVTFNVEMSFCGPVGHPEGRPFHMEGVISPNYFAITDHISFWTDRVRGRIGRC